MTTRLFVRTALWSAGLGLASPVLAQTDPATPAAASTGETIIVTATRSGDGVRRDQTGSSITVLDAVLLNDRQVRTVVDVLRDVPGVAVSRLGAAGGLTQVRLRGSEANHVLVLIDGIEVSDPFQGEFDFAGLLADDGARIEVLRGQQSALYGSDAVGGVIQYLTATGHDAPGISARIEGGSLGTVAAATRAAGVAGAFDYAVTGTYQRSGGYAVAEGGTRNVGVQGGAGSAKLTYTVSPTARITAVARYTRTDADFDVSESDPASPAYGRIVDSPGVRSQTEAIYGLVRGEISLLDGRWTNALGVQVADSRRDSFDLSGRTSGDSGNRVKGSLESTLRFGSPRVKHRVTLAVDLEREAFRNRDPSGFGFTGQRYGTDTGLVASYDVVADDRATFGASVRRDLNSLFADTTTYRVTASYALAGGTRLRAAAGSGVKNPGFFDLYSYSSGRYIGNPGLRPERSDGYEAGIDQTLFNGAVTAGLTWFDNRLHDEIYVVFAPPTFAGTPLNRASLSLQQGIEVFAEAHLDRWRFDAAYTHLDARQAGVREIRRAPDIASLSATWSAPRRAASLTATVRFNGPQTDITFTDPSFATTPIVRLHGYTLLNVSGEVAVTAKVSAFARVENALQSRHTEVFSYRAAPRTVSVGVRGHW